MTTPRVALVHERFTELGGSEKVVEQLHSLWPDAPVYAAVIAPAGIPPGLRSADLRPSALQRIYRGGPNYAPLLPLLPGAMGRVRLEDFDLVVTSHHAFANRVKVGSHTKLISYTHTPARWIWDPATRRGEGGGPIGRGALAAFAATQRRPDRAAAQRLDAILVNSRFVASRVKAWWGRDAQVIPPPIDTERFTPDSEVRREDFFLLAGRLVPYKRPELAIAAARATGLRLVVAGEGRSRAALQAEAPPWVEFLGAVDDDTLVRLYRSCRALVMPGVEDFGMIPVEAQACGAGVIARGAGGALDSVVDGLTGVLYPDDPDEVGALAAAMVAFDPSRYDPQEIRTHAETYSVACFRRHFEQAVVEILST